MEQASLSHAYGWHLLRCRPAPPRSAFLLAGPQKTVILQGQRSRIDAHAKVEQRKTYLGEKFWQIQPSDDGRQADYRDAAVVEGAPQIRLKSLNHAALEAADVPGLTEFYTKVLGFNSVDRPDFPFGGSWLEGAGLLLHIIQEDPSVPKQTHDWKEKYAEQPPQTWYIRRANHLAFEVEDADAMEARLLFFGIEYTKAVVPGVEAAQLFFFDPEGHGVEVGCDYAKVADMLKVKFPTKGTAVAP